MYSTSFASYYDLLMGDYSAILNTTKDLVITYIPKKSSILELGCGTGNMLQSFKNNYILSGLDIAPAMLRIAKKKVPQATYYEADITTFSVREKFDGIFCVFDTINHVTSFDRWQMVFDRVHKQLKNNGIFIFDMNTVKRMEFLANRLPYVAKLDKETITCIKITKTDEDIYRGKFQIFHHIYQETVGYIEEIVDEATFPLTKVKLALQEKFVIEAMRDPFRKKVGRHTGRVFFVCKKR